MAGLEVFDPIEREWDEYDDATEFQVLDDGVLYLSDDGGEIAAYAAGRWHIVRKLKAEEKFDPIIPSGWTLGPYYGRTTF